MAATYLLMNKAWQTIFLQVALEKFLYDVRATDTKWHDLAVCNFLRFDFSDTEYSFAAHV